MNDDLKKTWHECLESIKVSVSPAIYSTWFSQTHISALKQTDKRALAEIGCPSPFIKSTVENRYYGLIQDTLSNTLNKTCDLVFVIKQNPDLNIPDTEPPLFAQESVDTEELNLYFKRSKLRVNFTFDNFAVSSSNQMAWAAADAVSKNPGSAYNPLFIWGGVGVGKTHLMNSVGYYLLSKNKDAKVRFCTGEDFTNDIVEGIRNKTTQDFRNKYRKLDLLMLDDIQFIAGKDAVQEEFFHTFNALVGNFSQIVLTSDRPPTEISKLEDRLKSRFEAGLIVDISPPDFELRCAIIQIKAKERGFELDNDIVQMIAGNIDSARKMEGFLTRIVSEAKLKNTDINSDLIEKLLGKGDTNEGQMIKASPNDVISAVSKYFSVGKRLLLGESRARPFSHPRQILMYILRTQLSLTLDEVGRVVGGRDHTTVMHAVDKITHKASTDVNMRGDIRGIKNLL